MICLLPPSFFHTTPPHCSEPDNMRYMIRLGSHGFANMGEMITELKRSATPHEGEGGSYTICFRLCM